MRPGVRLGNCLALQDIDAVNDRLLACEMLRIGGKIALGDPVANFPGRVADPLFQDLLARLGGQVEVPIGHGHG